MKESVSEKEIFSVNQFIAEKNYWLEKMSGELTRSAFPYDFKGKDMQGEERLLVKFDIAAEQLNRLNKLSAGSDMKLHMILTACISLLLYKYTGDEDIIVGSPIYQQDIEGEFINTVLAFRNQISKKNTFKEFLLLVRQTMIEAVKNQNYPIEKLLYLMDISNDFEGFPLFDSLILLNTVHNRSYVEGIKTNILFQFDRKEQSLEGIIEYNASAYKTDTIERMIYHLSLLMEQVINNVDIKIEAIDIISKQEREQLLDHFNQTQVQQYSDSLLHQLFENQVTKTPTQPAIIFEGQSLSYQELNQKANQLALRLRQSGVSAGEIVGIMSKRSLQMMIAILGILKSGGAYVPIDPDYPEDRVEFVLKDSRVSRLLVYCNEEYTNINDIEIFNLNDEVLYQGETTDLPHNSRPTDLAYVIYTSGTTGTPKGVLINHKGIVNTILWRQSEYGLTTSDRVLQLFSYSFDGFLTSAFTPLIAGATVVFLNDADAKDPLAISALIGKHRVSHFISVPVLYDAILDSISPTDLKNIKMVTLAGEKASASVILKSKEKCPQIQLDIEYGPTESSVAATVFRDIKPGLEGRIGKPIANTKLFILDQNNSLLPIGIPGELCISGVGLAQGYLNKELLTKEKFIDNPFYKEDTETSSYQRMYRTGDLVKWLKDGNIQFLGRIDNQVKIRSFRIELGEIENQLLSHEKIKAAIVIAKENENSDKYLCAYYVAKEQISGSQLRDFLRSILPDYMVPAYFIQLEQMPVTANGKVDRKALPEPKDQLIIEANYVAPRNRIEEKMAMVWQEVLGISQIGMDDNFFALGGDSIKAIQIAAKLKNEQLKLNVQDLFRYKNIGTLSSYVEEDTIAVCQGEVCGEVLLAPVQRWFFQNTFAEMNHFNQSVILFKKERFDAEITERTLKKLVIHHDALRMTFNRDGEQIRQYNRDTAGTLYTFKVFNFTKDQDFVLHAEDEMNRLQRSMNLETGPLLGAALFQTHEGDHLFIVVHHLVIDGVSWRILFQDFSDCYDAFYAGNEPQLMNKSNSYMEWTKSLNEYANSAELLAEIEYWQQLEQLDVPLLPKDMQANSNKMIDSSDFSIQLSKEYTRLLMNQVNLAYHTEINDILLTALGITIRDFTGAELIKIDMEGHGRENIIEGIDINRTVGWFTSTYPVALHMGAAQLLSVQIKDVKETVRKIKNKGIGYGILKYMTAKENLGSLRFNRQPEISFNYLGQFDEDITNKVFTVESALKSEDMSLLYTRTHTLEFSGMVSGGCLSMTVNYNKKEFKTVTIENLMNNLKQNIIAIILHCVEKDNAEITPSDVSREEITPAEFEEITAMLDDL